MITKLLAKLFGTSNQREIRKLYPIISKINSLESNIKKLSDQELSNKTKEFKEQIDKGKKLDDILPEAYAVVREASFRKLGQRQYDVQLMGGVVLHQGKISEMKTGEGKTLTATLPLYLNALTGKGVHLVTVNDYLAKRDAQWMGEVYNFLGLSVGVIQNSLSDHQRKEIYKADIVYATNNELGFDYLRDNMKFRLADYVQRDLNYAIVDEVDSILIDEARTPLIISGSSDESSELYSLADKAILSLTSSDYEVDEKHRSVQLNESGNDKVESFFSISNLYDLENLKLLHHVNQALKAHTLFKKDFQYVVKDNQVLIVDEFTGRILPGRRYSDGLHQAIEAKEHVEIESESQTLASITLQNYFRLYNKLAGMTGTAATESEEFHKIYKLDVVSIPTNKPMIRLDHPDLIFLSKNGKYKSIIEDVKKRYKKGQPILIGTVAVETSEFLSDVLKSAGIPHDVLNAKNHAREADIVAHAGEAGRVTIATNMAGRGTDIKLTKESIDAGGLYILGTERHDSRRIDNQLRGRSGRQGDPGESRFYISLEDDLIRIFSGANIKKNMEFVGMTETETIESKYMSKVIERSQEKVEKYNFEIRKNLLEYDDVHNQQRTVIYNIRRKVLEQEDSIFVLIKDIMSNVVQDIVDSNSQNNLNVDNILNLISEKTEIPLKELEVIKNQKYGNSQDLYKSILDFLFAQYDQKIANLDEKKLYLMSQANKWLMLENIDQAWKQHMLNLDHLKEGISLRSWGQRNPLIEYKREAFAMFEDMMREIKSDIVQMAFHMSFEHFDEQEVEKKKARELEEINLLGPDSPEANISVKHVEKVGRNEDCPCGSNKKYKKCCLIK